ncbi:MAG TPA: bifunctional salicylyl-CoA 5-hydroxylase/oxidoreductase, partial [Actinomycetota bacterium]
VRDREFVGAVDRWFVTSARGGSPPAAASPPAFAPVRLRGLALANRVAVAARPAYVSEPGRPAVEGLVAAAGTGAGLVFTETVAVSLAARATPADPALCSDEDESAWARGLATVRAGPAIGIALSLGHAGARGATRPRDSVADAPAAQRWPLVAASPLPYGRRAPVPEELTTTGMAAVTADFVAAAGRAARAGFDLLELHMGHGYLLSSFLSPLTNQRTDTYGDSLENRLRFPLELVKAVHAAWPDDRPLGVLLNASDWARGGSSLTDAVEAARALRDRGCDVVRVVAGQTIARHRPRYDPYWLTHYADTIRNEAGVAVIATGDLTTVDDVNTVVAGGRADLCLLRL